jgi:histidine ammonia-lyase
MATYAARRLGEIAWNGGNIVAIELLAAAQGIDLRRPLETSPRLKEIQAGIRETAAFLGDDRPLSPDIAAVHERIAGGWFTEVLEADEDIPILI